MKPAILLTIAIAIVSITLGGCYTQLSTSRDDRSGSRYEADATQYNTDEDTASYAEGEAAGEYDAEGSYNDDGQYRQRVGFSYYYPSCHVWPSTMFSVAYTDPWFYDWNWSYDPYYYRSAYYNPYYGWSSGYYNPWYSPYWSHPPAYYYGGGYGSNVKTRHRDFGTTRTATASGRDGGGRGATVGGTAAPDVPRGAAVAPGGGRSGNTNRSSRAVEPRRTPARERTYTPRGTYGGRSQSGTRNEGTRQGGRDNPAPSVAPGGSQSGSSGRSGGAERAPSSGNRDSGGRGRSPSYTPPSSPPPQQAPPPSSGGGSAPSNSGSRGGGGRKP